MMKILKSFNSCLERQTNKTIMITSSKAEVVLNGKSEFHHAPIRRVVVTAGLQALQEEEQGWVAVGRRGAARGNARTARGATRGARGSTRAARGRGSREARRGA